MSRLIFWEFGLATNSLKHFRFSQFNEITFLFGSKLSLPLHYLLQMYSFNVCVQIAPPMRCIWTIFAHERWHFSTFPLLMKIQIVFMHIWSAARANKHVSKTLSGVSRHFLWIQSWSSFTWNEKKVRWINKK